MKISKTIEKASAIAAKVEKVIKKIGEIACIAAGVIYLIKWIFLSEKTKNEEKLSAAKAVIGVSSLLF